MAGEGEGGEYHGRHRVRRVRACALRQQTFNMLAVEVCSAERYSTRHTDQRVATDRKQAQVVNGVSGR